MLLLTYTIINNNNAILKQHLNKKPMRISFINRHKDLTTLHAHPPFPSHSYKPI